jgi:hypothetical protein
MRFIGGRNAVHLAQFRVKCQHSSSLQAAQAVGTVNITKFREMPVVELVVDE